MTRPFIGLSGLTVDYQLTEQGIVGDCCLGRAWQGYQGWLHGGIAATLMDDAMVHLLQAHGVTALTAALAVRYHQPIDVCQPLTVEAHLHQCKHGLYQLYAKLVSKDRQACSADGKFMVVDH